MGLPGREPGLRGAAADSRLVFLPRLRPSGREGKALQTLTLPTGRALNVGGTTPSQNSEAGVRS